MQVLKSVGVMSVARIMGLIYGCMGLLFAPLFLVFGILGSVAGQNKNPMAGVFGIVFAIAMPFLYGLAGFVMGALGGLLYNWLSKWVGGVELELELQPARSLAPYPMVPPATPVA
jgi:hypothetical protein